MGYEENLFITENEFTERVKKPLRDYDGLGSLEERKQSSFLIYHALYSSPNCYLSPNVHKTTNDSVCDNDGEHCGGDAHSDD
ncbi:hypothetical protein NPIL_587121, partial [Nephila pilipes]